MSGDIDEISIKQGRRFIVHTVQKGDTLFALARRHKTTVDDIMRYNPQIEDRDKIYPGQKVDIPTGSATKQKYAKYTVVHGDNLTKIATKFKTTVKAIVELNPQIKDPNLIITGWVLKVPDNR